MSISIKGTDKLLKKLDELGRIDYRNAIEDIVPTLSETLKEACPKDTGQSSKHIDMVQAHDDVGRHWVEVGFSSRAQPFKMWKAAYFQNFGYRNRGLGGRFKGRMVVKHYQWFGKAVDNSKRKIEGMLKQRLKQEVNRIIDKKH